MKATTTRQTKHAVCFTSDTPASFPSVFPPDRTVVTIHSASLTIIFTSSVMVDDCETSISVWSAINSVNESIFFGTQTIIRATSAIIVVLQRTIAQPHTIIDRTPAIVFASQITVSDVQITISVTETVICGGHQNPANQRVPDGSEEIIISVPKTIIDGNETIISVLQIMISKTNAIMSKRILVIDGPYTIISGLDSIIYRHDAIVSVVETMISTTETAFSKTDAIISAFATRFLAAEITVSAAEITTRAVPVGCAPSTNPTFPGFRLMALILFKDRKTLDLRCGKCQTRVMARLDIDINKLSPEERLDLIEELWDSLSADPAKIPLTDAQAKELDHRVSEMDLEDSLGIPWETVLAQIRERR